MGFTQGEDLYTVDYRWTISWKKDISADKAWELKDT